MIYVYILVMAVVTYLIRAVPLTVFQKKIENKYIKSFLYYVPYACLTAMTFPAILYATNGVWSAVAGLVVAIALSLFNRSLTTVALAASVTVFIVEWFFY
ncbi:MAG: AzlD domain-containing protein [Lachnospiraceae bacterium]|nr:AzlD domain-containing protein [Lachnospiraceae bacterium]